MDVRSSAAQRVVVALAVAVTATLGTAVAALRAPAALPVLVVTDGTAPGVSPARMPPPKAQTPRPAAKPRKAAAKPAPPAQQPTRPGRELTTQVRRAAPSRQCPGLPTVSAAPAWAGYAKGSSVTVHDARGGRAVRSLANPTRDHQHLVVGVVSLDDEWAFVRYSERPNGSVGWVKLSQLDIYSVAYRVVVQRCARRLTVFRQGNPVYSAPVAVGKGSTPTPLVEAYVDYLYRWPDPNGDYGAYSIGVAAFSEVYERFGRGGVGQIAIHGTTSRWSVGRAASNGCVRMYNEDVTQVARYARPGTPVTLAP